MLSVNRNARCPRCAFARATVILAILLCATLAPSSLAQKAKGPLDYWGIPRVETFYPRDTGVKGDILGTINLANGEITILTSVGCFTFDGTNWTEVEGISRPSRGIPSADGTTTIICHQRGLSTITPNEFGGYDVKTLTPPEKYDSSLPSLEYCAQARGYTFGLAGKNLVIIDPEGNITYQQLDNWATSCFSVGDEIYLTGGLTTLLNRWDWEKNALVDSTELLDSSGVYDWMIDVIARDEGGVWLLTQENRIIGFDGKSSYLWKGSDYLTQNNLRVTSFAQTAPETLAIGTSSNGLLVIDESGVPKLEFSKKHGLDDVNIHAVGFDNQDGIWIATENRLTRLPSQPISIVFNENHGISEDILCLALFRDRIYFGTRHGLYASNPQATSMDQTFVRVDEQTEIVDLLVADDTLFISGPTTLIMNKRGKISQLAPSGATNFHHSTSFPDTILAGNDRGIQRYKKIGGSWKALGPLQGPEKDIYCIAEDKYGNIFGSLGNTTIARIYLSEDEGHYEFIDLNAPSNGMWITPVIIEGEAYVNTTPCLRWDETSQKFLRDPGMIYYPGAAPYGFEQVYGRSSEKAYVALNARSSITVPRPDSQVIGDISSIGYAIDTRANCIAYDDSGHVWAGGKFGLLRAIATADRPTIENLRPRLHKIVAASTQRLLPTTTTTETPSILQPYENSLQISVEFPSYSATDHQQFQIYIEGLDHAWEKFSDNTHRELINLAPGFYTIFINAVDATGTTYSAHNYYFTVLTPWYLMPWAFALYLLAILISIWSAFRYYTRAQIKKSRSLERLVSERTQEIVNKNNELEQQALRLEQQNEQLEEKTEELTTTTETLTSTLHQLQDMQTQLVDTARTAGKAEIAINVLHNVGNVLNSLNVSINVLIQKTESSKSLKLTRLAELVQAHQGDIANFITNDPKGKKVPTYLIQLSRALEEEVASIQHELAVMSEDIDHVKSVINAQQTHAKSESIVEDLNIQDLCQTALNIVGNERSRTQIEVINEIPEDLVIENDKHRLLDIVLNLISNAIDAIDDQSPEIGVLTLQAENHPDSQQIEFRVTDNGSGIAPENLEKLFRHGFTTKPKGHGFGLHSSANAAKVLGGELHLNSPGKGLGATATLTLPSKFTPAKAK